jgi:hypothetical protein|tara:strand:- start:4602 stop:4733 length:132 start_codon:yes stop_codon:yes gene_type:complete
MTWSNILNTHPATIRKKLSWYEKQKAQKSLDDFFEVEDNEKNQ